jgi:outer membrane protein
VLNSEDQLDVAKKQEEVSGKQVERLEIVFKEGAAAAYTVSDLKGERASNRVAVVNAGNNLEQARIELCRFMGIPHDANIKLNREDIALTVSGYDASSAEVYAESLNRMAMVKATSHREMAATKAVKVAKGALWPTVGLSGALATSYSSAAEKYSIVDEFYATTDNYVISNGTQLPVYSKQQNLKQDEFGFATQYNNNLNAQFGLNVQVPILNRFTVRNRIKQAKIDLKNAEAVTYNTSVQLQQDVDQAHNNMVAAFNRYSILKEQVEAMQESFRAAEVRFGNGVINSAEYLVIKNAYDRSAVNFTQAGYEYVLRTRILDYYRGRL